MSYSAGDLYCSHEVLMPGLVSTARQIQNLRAFIYHGCQLHHHILPSWLALIKSTECRRSGKLFHCGMGHPRWGHLCQHSSAVKRNLCCHTERRLHQLHGGAAAERPLHSKHVSHCTLFAALHRHHIDVPVCIGHYLAAYSQE